MRFLKIAVSSLLASLCSAYAYVASVYIPSPQELTEYSRSPSTAVRAAIDLKNKVDEQNSYEIRFLLQEISNRQNKLDAAQVMDRVSELIKNDKQRIIEYKKFLERQKSEQRGSAALRTSIGKLLGTGIVSGILDDALSLFSIRGTKMLKGALEKSPEQNEITVLKTLLIYMVLAVRQQSNLQEGADLIQELQLLYPASVPEVDYDLSNISLFFRDRVRGQMLMIPNAGYVFGGDFFENVCRGVDCSAFLSKVTGSSRRLNTMVMEYAWRLSRKDSFHKDDPSGKVRAGFMATSGLRQALEEFEAIEPKVEAIREGDVIAWRWRPLHSLARTGHVMLFIDWADRDTGEFVGIEANRADNKSLDGIVFRRVHLRRENADVYVLRRRGS